MCKNLVEKGSLTNPLIIYNRTTQRAHDLSSKIGNSKVASTISEAVESSDIIFICVGDDQAIKDTVATALEGDVKGKLFVDCSTVHPDTTSQIEKEIEGKGATFVACPVFGAPAMADNGQLVCVVAGKASEVEKVKPFTTGVMGRAMIDFSDEAPRQALTLKLIGNTMVLQMVESLAEAHVVAEKSGLGVPRLQDFISLMFPGPFQAYAKRMSSGDYYNRDYPLFQVDLARKDARHALNIAETNGAKMKAVEVADEHLRMVKEEKGEKGDLAGIYGAVRKESGLKYENQ